VKPSIIATMNCKGTGGATSRYQTRKWIAPGVRAVYTPYAGEASTCDPTSTGEGTLTIASEAYGTLIDEAYAKPKDGPRL
jgi:hypothetical protein